MSVSAYIFCVIGVGVAASQIMRVILWLDEPKRRRKRAAQKERGAMITWIVLAFVSFWYNLLFRNRY